MSSKFSKLPKTTFSGLEYQNIIEDIISLVKENPDYSDQYDDFLSSNAGRMLIELFAYITDQLSTRIDYVVNENFISTATQKSSVIKLLKLIGYNFRLPTASKVEVSVKAPQEVLGKRFTKPSRIHEDFVPPFRLVAEDRNGSSITFELVDPEKGYEDDNKIDNGIFVFQEGETRMEDFFVETENNQIFTLSSPSVIKDSVKVFRVQPDLSEPLEEVKSFLELKAQYSVSQKFQEEITEGSIEKFNLPYKLIVEEGNVVSVEFPPSDIVKNRDRRPNVRDKIRVFYRTGGGENGNIVPKSINIGKKITVYDNHGNVFDSSASVEFVNHFYGYGGEDEETVEKASSRAVAEIQTAKKTVTEEDYDIILGSFDEVLVSKSIGNSNPVAYSEKLYKKYGKYINPLEVWNFILFNKNSWEALDPEEYNNFNWLETRLENRVNDLIYFFDGESDIKHEIKRIDLISTSLGEITETEGGNTNKIVSSSTPFTSSFLGCSIKVKNAENLGNLDEERVITGGSGNEFFLDAPFLDSTSVDDVYSVTDNSSYKINTPAKLKEGVSLEDFGAKVTKGASLSRYFDEIENNLVIDGKIDKYVSEINEGVYPVFISKRNLDSNIPLNGNLILTIDGVEKEILFLGEPYSIDGIANIINESFTNVPNANDTFFIEGDTQKNSTEVTNIKYNTERIRAGMNISFGSFLTTIEEVFPKDGVIVLDKAPTETIKKNLMEITDSSGIQNNTIASVSSTLDGKRFIIIRSFTKGSGASIYIKGNLTPSIFGVESGTFVRGIMSIFLDNENNLIYRKNSYEDENIYLQYVTENSNTAIIGKKRESENPLLGKEQANRIYATSYNENTKKIDYFNSNFVIKFTKNKINLPSIYSIDDSWDLKQNSFPKVESRPIVFPPEGINISLDLKIDDVELPLENIAGSSVIGICDNINLKIREKNLDSLKDFINFDFAIPNGEKLVLQSPTNFNNSRVSVEEVSSTYLFFSKEEVFSEGDYFIKIDEEDNIVLHKSLSSNIPDFQFYVHFISDKRYVEGIFDGKEGRKGFRIGEIEEDKVKNKLDTYKITGVENVFRHPSFKVFDLVGTITYDKSFSRISVEREVEDVIRKTFSLKNSKIGESVFKSKLVSLVHSVPGVLYFVIDYFGLNKNDASTNQVNLIEADFDEIVVIGSDKRLDILYKSE